MFKIVNYVFLSLVFFCSIAQTLHGSGRPRAVVEGGIVRGSALCYFIRGSENGVHRTPPTASFCGSNLEHLGEVELKSFSPRSVIEAGNMVDPDAQQRLPVIVRVDIESGIKGRWLTGYDGGGNRVIQVHHYTGGPDVEGAAEAGNPTLPGPASLYSGVERVVEKVPQSVALALVGCAPSENTLVYKRVPERVSARVPEQKSDN